MKKLYDLLKGVKIYESCSDGSTYFVFDHIDGMYSYNTTEKGAVVHLSASAPMEAYKDGYRIAIEEENN